jgi:exopolysaccharide biosynthesis polyprenyl glycosylphosphotransferase
LATPPHDSGFYLSLAAGAVPIWLGLFALYGLYDRRNWFEGWGEYKAVANACTAGSLALVLMSFIDDATSISRGWLVVTWLLSMLFVASGRLGGRRIVRRLRTKGMLLTPTLIVGANEEGRAIAQQFMSDPGAGARVVGFLDDVLPAGTNVVGHLSVLGSVDALLSVAAEYRVNEIVIATTSIARERLPDLFQSVGHDPRLRLRLSSGLFEVLTTGVDVRDVASVPLITPERTRITGVDAILKACVDYLGAALLLILLWPVLLLIAVLVRLDSPGPVIYRRRVLGRGGTPFDAFKFRTMVTNAEQILVDNPDLRAEFEAGYKLKLDPRVTRVGEFLRRTSLDELPQLFNVLRGEMSLVGPRMIAPDEAPRYGKWQFNLLTVKPGITGPWQVSGRGDIPYADRVILSMDYIRNYSFWRDVDILLRTLTVVTSAKGAY